MKDKKIKKTVQKPRKKSKLRMDLESARRNDPAARNYFEIWLTYAGYHAVRSYRRAHFFHVKLKLKLLARIISQVSRFFTGIEIHPGAKIAGGIFIDHGTGVVIGETAEIGENCTLYQGVTLGGTGKDRGKRHPTLGNNVMVSAGAKVLGPINIGDNAKIGAGSVVLADVPENCTVVGVPGRVVRRGGSRPELDQTFPDPLVEEFAHISCALETLYGQIAGLEDEIAKLKKKVLQGEKK
ncbi:MAG: serine O-acetyltransferase [Clostridiales bacterium]|jgi:serine O-acetyltransferase|nr:serine O-acetyltransferase [Clostridiales bacterium]